MRGWSGVGRGKRSGGSSNLPRCPPRVPRVPSFLPRRSTLQVSTSAPPPEPGHAVGLVRVIIIACTMPPFTAIYHRERCPWDPNPSFKSLLLLSPLLFLLKYVSLHLSLTLSPSPPHSTPSLLHSIIPYLYSLTFITPSPPTQSSSRPAPLFSSPSTSPPCLARK